MRLAPLWPNSWDECVSVWRSCMFISSIKSKRSMSTSTSTSTSTFTSTSTSTSTVDVIGRKCLASRASQALMRAYGFVVRATSHEPGAEHHVLDCIVLDSLAQVCSTTRTSPRPLRRWSSALVHFRCRRWTLVIGRCGASNTKLTSSAFNVRHGG